MKVEAARYKTEGRGRSRRRTVAIAIAGMPQAVIYEDHRRQISRGHGAVFLGADFEDLVPPINGVGQDRNTSLRGFTKNDDVVQIAQKFIDDIDAGEFEDGKVVFEGQSDETEDDTA